MKYIVLAIFLFFALVLKGQVVPKATLIDVHNNNDFTGFQMLDSSIKNARIIMTGENHTYVNFNGHLEMKMLRLLNQKVGLKNFIIELGEARAHYLNRYINNADSFAEKNLKATTSPRYMDLFKRIRKYNLSLPDSLKVNIHGIDVERFYDLPLMRLAELMEVENVPQNLKSLAETVRGTATYLRKFGLADYEQAKSPLKASSNKEYQHFYINPTVKDIVRFWDSLNPDIRIWLGNKYMETEIAVNWLKQYLQWKKYENTTYQYIWREENIYKNLVQLLDNNPNEKYYGQFGRCHIAYEEQNGDCSWYGYHSVVNKLRTRYYKDKNAVLSIGIFYRGNSDNANFSDVENREDLNKEITTLADETKSHTVSLFNLNEAEKMTQLKNKFSFVIIDNKFIIDAEKDSVASEIEEIRSSSKSEFIPYTAIGFGLFSVLNTDNVFNQHVSANGFASELKRGSWISVDWNIVSEDITVNFGYAFMGMNQVYSTDSGILKYGANLFNFKILAHPFQYKNLQVCAGIQLGLGREKVEWIPKNMDFTRISSIQNFHNPIGVVAPVVRVQARLTEYIYVSTELSRSFDLSKNQWYYSKSTQKYGSENTVTKGLENYFLGINLGIAILDY